MNQPEFLIEALEEREDYGKFEIEPLDQGYGHTLGNALRRALLSSIKGAAVSGVMVDGVKHQFSSLKGMKEDMVEFVLQLKQVRVRLLSGTSAELTIDKVGPGEVKAGDIESNGGVEILNPELVLANLTDKKTNLKATIFVEEGYGYQLSEERKSPISGMIPMDTAFSPILRVRYDVKETRVGRRTDFDKLVIEVWTNGAVTPRNAILEAARTLISYFNQVVNPVIPEVKEVREEKSSESDVLNLTVEELDLPTRIANALRKGGFKTVGDLSKSNKEVIAKVKNLGGKSVNTVIDKLVEKGINLKD